MVESLGGAGRGSGRDEEWPLIVIVGPTASGKSVLALELAERLNGEIVNCDSVQVYRGFDVGSGKLPPAEHRGVPHHLLDIVRPQEVFTAGDYIREASAALASIRDRAKVPIIAGGTGLYLRALLLGLFEGPKRSEELRARLMAIAARRGCEFLHRMLRRFDARTASRVGPRDTQKIIRALEVRLLARQPLSRMLERGRIGLQGFRAIKIGLNPDRTALNRRIDARVRKMFEAGLVEETRGWMAQTNRSPRDAKPLVALGYRQASSVVRGEMSLEEAIRDTQAATRRYAKRQRTWFRRESDVTWFEGFGDEQETQRRVLEWLRSLLPAARPAAR